MSDRTCTIDGCKNKHRAKGYCRKHYLKDLESRAPQCNVEGCQNPSKTRGMCGKHAERVRRFGDPHKVKYILTKSAEESFDLRTEWQGDCLIWIGGKDSDGYGHIYVKSKLHRSHVWAWEKAYGSIPDGMEVDHQCHNPSCVNIEHLRLATKSQNGANRGKPNSRSTTGKRNVYRRGNKFYVQLNSKQQFHYFGTYETLEEAANVAEQARQELFGEFAGRG